MAELSGGRTVKRSKVRYVVVVSSDENVLAACRYAASVGAAAIVESCDVGELTNTVATWQPLAIVMPGSVYEFDAQEFDALGRDVRGKVVPLPDPIPSDASLREWLVARMREAAAYRAGTGDEDDE